MTDSLSAIHHLIDDAAAKPAGQADDFYRSSNGDVWRLVRGTPSLPPVVRHTANASSGGMVSDLSIEEFLAINSSGPEHAALRLLLGKTATA